MLCGWFKFVLMRIFLYIIIAVFISATAKAQFNLGIATGNWSGMNSLYLNPADIADSRAKFVIDILSVNAGVENSLGTINSRNGLIGAALHGDSTNHLFNYSNSNKFSLLAPYAQIRLPGIMVSINHKHSFALTTGIRGMNQFNNFDQSLYKTIADPTYVPNGNVDLTSNKFNYTAQLWSEVGLTYAGVVLDKEEHEIKVGATLRYLGGIGYLSLKGNNLNAHYKSGVDSLYVTNTDLEFASNIVSTRNAVFNGFSNGNFLNEFFGAKGGVGVGGDIGVVYDYMPDYERDKCEGENKSVRTDHSKNRYKLRISASVMDIGAITYKSQYNSNAEVTGNGNISGSDFSNNVHNYNDFRAYSVSHGFTADTSHQNTKVYMPTTLRLFADYNILGRFYVNAGYIGNLANRQNFGNSYYSQITVTPRYDCRKLSLALPITYSMLDKSMKMGFGIRYSGFYIGSDDMIGLVASNQSGVNIYGGGFIEINKRKPKGTVLPKEDVVPEPDMEHGGSPDTTVNSPDGSASMFNNRVNSKYAIGQQKTVPANSESIAGPEKQYAIKKQE